MGDLHAGYVFQAKKLPNMIWSSLVFIIEKKKLQHEYIPKHHSSSNPNLQQQLRDKPKTTF